MSVARTDSITDLTNIKKASTMGVVTAISPNEFNLPPIEDLLFLMDVFRYNPITAHVGRPDR